MRRWTNRAAVAALCGLAACGGSDDTVENDLETPVGEIGPAVGASAVMGDTTTVPLQPLAAQGPGGQVMLLASGATTRVLVQFTGASGAGVHQGHIHQGTCESPGAVVAPLNPVATNDQGEGESASNVELAKLDVLNGEHIVAYHAPGGDPGPTVTCASLPEAELEVGL